MKYRKEIDGLRALAVLPVIFYHSGVPGFAGGFIGVDVFFVISGFLITGIIISSLRKGDFSFADFYERRARRILPALFLMLGVSFIFAYRWMTPDQFVDFSEASLAIGIFSSNFLFWHNTDYFAPDSELNPLLHTWSLAVEEQFYIFFPVLLFLMMRKSLRRIITVVAVISLASLLWAEYYGTQDAAGNFYLLPSRAWELGAGAICALVSVGTWGKKWLSMIGLLMVVGAIVIFDKTLQHPSLYTMVPVVGSCLILLYGTRDTLVGRFLSLYPLVFVGLISYSAYLWHQPILAFTRIRAPGTEGWELGVLVVVLSLGLAYFSWKYVESPFRKKGPGSLLNGRRQVALSAACMTSIAMVAGGWVYVLEGVPERTAPSGKSYAMLDLDTKMAPNQGFGSMCEWKFTLDPECRDSEEPLIAVWGDSYAMQLVNALLASPAYEGEGIIQLTKSACSPLLDIAAVGTGLSERWAQGCIDFNQSVKEWLSTNQSVEYVVMSSSWGILGAGMEGYLSDGRTVRIKERDLIARINATADFLRALGKTPVMVSPAPSTGDDLSLCPVATMKFGGEADCSFKFEKGSDHYQTSMRLLSDKEISLPLVNLTSFVCPQGVCAGFWGGDPVYRDKGHLSIPGSTNLGVNHDFWRVVRKAADEKNSKHVTRG